MVDAAGHFGAALIVLSPIWFYYDSRAAATFVAFGLPFSQLPDIDIWLKAIIPTIHHHGITHTILFVTLVSLAGTVIITPTLLSTLKDTDRLPGDEINRPYRFTFSAFWVASLCHIGMDMVASPDVKRYQPVEPFWPLFHQPVTLDVIYYDAFVWNWGLLAVGTAITLGLWWWN